MLEVSQLNKKDREMKWTLNARCKYDTGKVPAYLPTQTTSWSTELGDYDEDKASYRGQLASNRKISETNSERGHGGLTCIGRVGS